MGESGKQRPAAAPTDWRIDLKGLKSTESMLRAVASAMAFPAHFGVNLDALYDCLTDLPLNSGPRYTIRLAELARVPAGDAVYAVFADAAEFWRDKGVSISIVRD